MLWKVVSSVVWCKWHIMHWAFCGENQRFLWHHRGVGDCLFFCDAVELNSSCVGGER